MVRNLPLVKLVGRQSVSRRAKGASSLKRKLEDRGILDAPDIERTIKDLAGARVILYTNSDVDAFLKRRIIPEIFKIHWDEVKAHPKNRRGYGLSPLDGAWSGAYLDAEIDCRCFARCAKVGGGCALARPSS
jgi:hypothetical protein